MEIAKRILNNNDGSYVEYYHKKGDDDCWHREDGPAFIEYNEDGSIHGVEYWVNNKLISKKEWESEYGWKLKLQGSPMGEIFNV